jgi:hypothetical protein
MPTIQSAQLAGFLYQAKQAISLLAHRIDISVSASRRSWRLSDTINP